MSPETDATAPKRASMAWIPYAVVVLLLAALGAGGWWAYERVNRLEQGMAELDRAVDQAEEQAAVATRRADDAERAAADAGVLVGEAREEAAEEAAGRLAAEDAARVAETEAEFARQDAERAAEAARVAQAETERIRDERDREISRLQTVLGGIAPTRRTALGLVMNLGEDSINFEYDKADLQPGDRELLSRIIGVLLTTTGFGIQVFGHTDDVASQAYNQALSERRAQAVTDYLVAGGIDPAIITTKGFGKLNPVAEGTSEEARAMNRRVELGIIDSTVEYTSEARKQR